MAADEVRASKSIQAPAARVYNIIADYHDGHPRIVPPKYFKWMRVETGGTGAGTTLRFAMRVMGTTSVLHALVSEPEPGRRLVESYPGSGGVTTFVVEPEGAGASRVTIATALGPQRGLRASIERWVSRRVLPAIYEEELQRLAEHAEGRRVHEPVGQG
jgi:uncharacterized protein YndB with AHSA1/START domain